MMLLQSWLRNRFVKLYFIHYFFAMLPQLLKSQLRIWCNTDQLCLWLLHPAELLNTLRLYSSPSLNYFFLL